MTYASIWLKLKFQFNFNLVHPFSSKNLELKWSSPFVSLAQLQFLYDPDLRFYNKYTQISIFVLTRAENCFVFDFRESLS